MNKQVIKTDNVKRLRGIAVRVGSPAKTAEGFLNPKAPHNQSFIRPKQD